MLEKAIKIRSHFSGSKKGKFKDVHDQIEEAAAVSGAGENVLPAGAILLVLSFIQEDPDTLFINVDVSIKSATKSNAFGSK